MIAYHIDRANSLSAGQIINYEPNFNSVAALFEDKITKHGVHYLDPCSDNEIVSFAIEHEFELIRQRLFPNRISRFQSFFALEDATDILYWPDLLSGAYKIWEIEFSHPNYEKHDAYFFTWWPYVRTQPCMGSTSFI